MHIYKTYKHNPPHLFLSNTNYFITAATYQKVHYFSSDADKEKLYQSIAKGFNENGWVLEDWVILNNHYHIMVRATESPDNLVNIIRDIHKFTALHIRKKLKVSENIPQIWHNYWDTCIDFARSYYSRLNYLWYNPENHKYAENAKDWKFGSYHYRIKEEKEYLDNLKTEYPFDKIKIDDNF